MQFVTVSQLVSGCWRANMVSVKILKVRIHCLRKVALTICEVCSFCSFGTFYGFKFEKWGILYIMYIHNKDNHTLSKAWGMWFFRQLKYFNNFSHFKFIYNVLKCPVACINIVYIPPQHPLWIWLLFLLQDGINRQWDICVWLTFTGVKCMIAVRSGLVVVKTILNGATGNKWP